MTGAQVAVGVAGFVLGWCAGEFLTRWRRWRTRVSRCKLRGWPVPECSIRPSRQGGLTLAECRRVRVDSPPPVPPKVERKKIYGADGEVAPRAPDMSVDEDLICYRETASDVPWCPSERTPGWLLGTWRRL